MPANNKVSLHTSADDLHILTEEAHRKLREDASPEKKAFRAALMAVVMDHGLMVRGLTDCGVQVLNATQSSEETPDAQDDVS